MDWFQHAFIWYFVIFLLGIVFFPLTQKVFSKFIDSGYSLSKTIAVLITSYIVFVLGSLKIPVFNNYFTAGFVSVFFGLSIYFYKFNEKNDTKINLKLIIFEEILFTFSFFLYTYIRGQQPAIHGLEKFMDFGIINSILRSKYFPPLDIWLSGSSINYYYFGHLASALLIKITNIKASIGYNLTLSTIFAISMTSVFTICISLINIFKKVKLFTLVIYGFLGSLIVNLSGNLHTIYLFTSGYPNDNPIPFWKIFSSFTPEKYWYPNATRFIPFTIHEFPSYSFTVADLHGHVLSIPFVLLTIAFLLLFFTKIKKSDEILKKSFYFIFIGFMIAILYMTNAFDGPIYLIFALAVFLTLFGLSLKFLFGSGITIFSAILFSIPFTSNFKAFITGIGINCPPQILSNIKKFGPFLFEAGNCQPTPAWMLFVLWGFFLTSFSIFIAIKLKEKIRNQSDDYALLLMLISTIFILIPEFFYVKDIYPAHFRANTMFKLGYQAFIMMSIASLFVFFRLNSLRPRKYVLKGIYIILLTFILIYPFFSFSSFYHPITNKAQIDGSLWMKKELTADYEIIEFFNKNIQGQPVILEAQGDSYTDFARISSFTGLPTVAGWWVHEWLWRGSADIVGKRIPDIKTIYESDDILKTEELINKYNIEYIVVSGLERSKYKSINKDKFERIWTKIFEASDKNGAVYKAKLGDT